MSTPSDLTKTGSQLVYALINAANPGLANGALDPTNTTLSAPTALTGDPSGQNTKVTVNATAGHGYINGKDLTYNRLDIQTQVFSVLAPTGAALIDAATPYVAVQDILAAVNTKYGINLQASDVANPTDALVGASYPKTATINIAAGSLTYVGSLVVTINQPQIDLSQAITVTQLSGLNPPVAA